MWASKIAIAIDTINKKITPSESMQRFLVLISTLLLLGCQIQTADPERDAKTGAKPADPSDRKPATVKASLPSDQVIVEATGDQWKTEQASEKIDRHLKALSDVILGSGNRDELLFIDEAVEYTELRPTETDLAYQDASLEIRQSSKNPNQPIESQAQVGRAGLLAELKAIVKQPRPNDTSDLQTAYGKFKITSVRETDRDLQAELLWQLSLPTRFGNYQQIARWHSNWSLTDQNPRLLSISLLDFREVQAQKGRGFVDCTNAVTRGTSNFARQFSNSMNYWLDRLEYRFAILPSSYQGIAIADVNGDGLEDIFLPQPGGVVGGLPNRLLLQQADGTLLDHSTTSGLDWLIETHSALFVDLDNDGDQDIIVATVMGLVFAANDGTGRFEKRGVKLTPEAPPMSLTAADFDDDGDLDIYACCYSPRTSSSLMGRPIPYHDANNGGRNLLLRNDRDWRFRNVTQLVGLDTNNRRFSFAAAWEDYDNDNDMDLYVANDYGRNNLFRNEGGKFTDVAAELGVEDISAGMSATWGDYNRDGWMDLYISNMWSSAGKRIAYQRQFQPKANGDTRSYLRRHARGNSLFTNQLGSDQSTFQDASLTAGVTMGRWAWAARFADLNNNGYLDLVVANGFITQEDTSDL